ncbi:MAG TPA: thioester reductase domain-containing protein [Candidatus Polarisedimenticolaceae bacterium]
MTAERFLSRSRSIVDFVQRGAEAHPDRCLYRFLDIDGEERDSYTYLGFHERTRHLAEHLSQSGLRRGDRVILVYPPGLEVIVAFFACARIGVIAVPTYPPTPMNFETGLGKLAFVAKDCDAKAALTTRGFLRSYRLLLAKRKLTAPWRRAPGLPSLEWVTTDDARGVASEGFRDDPHPTLFLQYTSGSTADPKGVIVTHENVIHNTFATLDHAPTQVSWLPQYHDMGLIGYYLMPAISGGTTYGFSPLDFLKRPALWLETISRVKATYTSSPNFGYEYCLREDKLPEAALAGLDLGSLRVMMNAAEPVRAETVARFFERFSPYGLRPESLVAAFGLAENTLCVSNHGRHVVTVNKRLLQQRRLHLEPDQARNNNQSRIVSCGKPLDGVLVRIVEPETRVALRDGEIGEIWVGGPSRCSGYWNRPELSRKVFEGELAVDDGERYMRTGDLGFVHEGELYVCGRIKDLIIIRGVNYYPQDIEGIVEASSSAIRTGGVAAFDVEEEGEALVVIVEVRSPKDLPDAAAIARAIRTQYYIEPHTIAFVPPRTIAKTTSGKIARARTREKWLNGEIEPIARHVSLREQEPAGDVSGLRERFQYIVELYNLTGREEYSFAEIGIDSLTMVRLIEDIKGLLEEHGAGELVRHVDVKLLQRLTIQEFFALIDQFERSSASPVAALRYVLLKVQQEHEEYERECMRSDAALERLPRLEIAERDAPVTDLLMTGVTGFFGPFLLENLLRQTPYRIHALARANDPVHGMDRIRAAIRRARLWTPALEERLERRVHVVCGDVSRHNLGLKSDQWKSLSAKVQAVCHNAALVNYVMSYDALRPHNVDGTREALRFASSGARKTFHMISSTFIYGWTAKDVLWETDANPAMENLDFGYAQSKWVAEQLVLAAEKQGLDVRIYRPSLISSSTHGVGSRDDIAIRLLAFMIQHGVAVSSRNQISFSPADVAANNIVALMRLPKGEERTFHVTVDDYYNMADVTRRITRDYGYTFAYYDIARFVAEMTRRSTRDDLIYPLLDFFNRSHEKLSAMQHKRYNNDAYRRARAKAPDARPDPTLEETVRYQMEFLLREGIIPKPDATRRESDAV